MLTDFKEHIEIDLPVDVLFAMKGYGAPEVARKKLKLALALFLFQEEAISLGKAVELAGIHRTRFIEHLQAHGKAAYTYNDQELAWDLDAVAAYRCAVKP